jgi:glycogen debranching enzyme
MAVASPQIQCLGATALRDLDHALSLEWLETNGIGGYASSTVVGAHTRRHHGLLVAALKPPVARHNLLTALDAALILQGRDHFLTCHIYPDTLFPQGHRTLQRFELDPFPRWTHRLPDHITVIHELWMDPGRNTTVLIWRLAEGASPVELSVVPLLGLRDFNALTSSDSQTPAILDTSATGCLTIRPSALNIEPLHLHHSPASLRVHDRWYRAFQLPVEATRETDHAEDLWNPGALRFELRPDEPAVLIATTEGAIGDPRIFASASWERRVDDQGRFALACPAEPAAERLAPAVRAFRVARDKERPTILAGYHWFSDWGRDTMIALPGLCLIPGRTEEAMAILRHWMSHLDQGMLPNRFPDHGEPPEYNTVDATLWFSVAVLRTWQCLGGRGPASLVPGEDPWAPPSLPRMADLSNAEASFLHEALRALDQIVTAHRAGTRHGIRLDHDGLITQGEPGLQLTWMDAKWEDQVFTPRQGKPIEVQALWLNTLRTTALLRRLHGDVKSAEDLEALAGQVVRAVEEKFWHPERPGLADVISPEEEPDWSIRPNQIFAVSLPFPVVSREVAMDVFVTVDEHLLTPYGLRSLSPTHLDHIGVYEGPRPVRDAAYHQGTVWSWLIGPWVDAALRVHGATPEIARNLRGELEPLVEHIDTQAGLGSVSEIFDSDPPHAPRGCIAQAWSVAELLRVLWVLSQIR